MQIQRYDFVQPDNWQGYPYPESAYMELCDDGEYVMFDDYAIVLAQRDAYKQIQDNEVIHKKFREAASE